MTNNITQLEAKKRALNAKLKTAKQAAAKAQKAQLLHARQALGVHLAGAVGADTCEAVAALSDALSTDQVLTYLRQRIAPESAPVSLPDSDANASESGHSYSDQL